MEDEFSSVTYAYNLHELKFSKRNLHYKTRNYHKQIPRLHSLVVFAPASHCATARRAPMLEKLQLRQNGFVTLRKKLHGAYSSGSQRLLGVPPVLTLEKLRILDAEGI